jgi:hypothetical protein
MMELHKSRDKNKGVNRITNQHKKKGRTINIGTAK